MRTIGKNATTAACCNNSLYKKSATVVTTIAVAVILSSCAIFGQRFDPSLLDAAGDHSAIVVYRVGQFYGSLHTPGIKLDGKSKGDLKNGGWIGAAVTPGRHVIALDTWIRESRDPDPITVETLPSQSYFIRYDLSGPVLGAGEVPIVGMPRNKFTLVPREQALEELKTLNQSN